MTVSERSACWMEAQTEGAEEVGGHFCFCRSRASMVTGCLQVVSGMRKLFCCRFTGICFSGEHASPAAESVGSKDVFLRKQKRELSEVNTGTSGIVVSRQDGDMDHEKGHRSVRDSVVLRILSSKGQASMNGWMCSPYVLQKYGRSGGRIMHAGVWKTGRPG